MDMEKSIIYFNIDNENFNHLQKIFYELKTSKESDDFKDDKYWLNLFKDKIENNFYFLEKIDFEINSENSYQDLQDYLKKEIKDYENKWDFGSFIDAFKDAEINLISCEKDNSIGRIEFFILSFPYGGYDCLNYLIKCFNFKIFKEINTGNENSDSGNSLRKIIKNLFGYD